MQNDANDRPDERDDVIVEPPNSTVDDWFGQDVERDTETAEQAVRDAGGDEHRAEELFEERRGPHAREEFDVPSEAREGNVPGA